MQLYSIQKGRIKKVKSMLFSQEKKKLTKLETFGTNK
jgi:hypothetical protein